MAVELEVTLILLSSEGSGGGVVFKSSCRYDVWLKGNRMKVRCSG